ncbi:MAG: hypothetical protein LBK01_09220 [Burkholderiaceae bacterium]|jgi:hypothetical protein|nr:hypothetical protein [Burkholderiaceae bacterium]
MTQTDSGVLDLDEITKRAIEGQKAMLQDMLRRGIPLVYADDTGAIVRKMPGGKVEILHEPPSCEAVHDC